MHGGMERLDKDGDGRISRAEFDAGKAASLAALEYNDRFGAIDFENRHFDHDLGLPKPSLTWKWPEYADLAIEITKATPDGYYGSSDPGATMAESRRTSRPSLRRVARWPPLRSLRVRSHTSAT